MRLYKQKDTPKSLRGSLDSPPGSPSVSPASPTPYKLKRAAEAVSKQISGHKAMVAQFKGMRLPRPPMFSTKPATPTQPDHSHSLQPTQTKSTKGFGKPQTVPDRSPIPKAPISPVTLKQRAILSNLNTNSPSPTRPPGLGLEKATLPVNKPSAPFAALKAPRSVPSPIRSSRQSAGVAKPATPPSKRTSTRANLASVSVASAPAPAQVDVDEPILFVSCFHSLEEDPEMEEDLFQTVELTSDFESQVAQIFGVGLGCASDDEVIKHGEIAPPKATPETILAPTFEPMSAVVEWWEPTVNPATKFDLPVAVKSKGRTDGFEATPLDQNQDLLQTMELTSDFESQVAQIFGVGLGCASDSEVVKHGEIAPTKATPETMLTPTLEPMSAVVEWWEPTASPDSTGEFPTLLGGSVRC